MSEWEKAPLVESQPAWAQAPVVPNDEWEKVAEEQRRLDAARGRSDRAISPTWHAIREQIRTGVESRLKRVRAATTGSQIGDQQADELVREGAAVGQAIAEKDPEGLAGLAARGFRGAAVTLPETIAAGALGGPAGAIGMAAVQEANHAITEGRDAGLQGSDLTRYAAAQGAIEAVPAAVMQKLGLGGMESIFGKGGSQAAIKGLSQAAKQAGFRTISELPEEIVTELGHSVYRAVEGVDPNAVDPDRLVEVVKETAAQTIATMGMVEAPHIAQGGMVGTTRQKRYDTIQKIRQREQQIPSRKEAGLLGYPIEAPNNAPTRRAWFEENHERLVEEFQPEVEEAEETQDPDVLPFPEAEEESDPAPVGVEEDGDTSILRVDVPEETPERRDLVKRARKLGLTIGVKSTKRLAWEVREAEAFENRGKTPVEPTGEDVGDPVDMGPTDDQLKGVEQWEKLKDEPFEMMRLGDRPASDWGDEELRELAAKAGADVSTAKARKTLVNAVFDTDAEQLDKALTEMGRDDASAFGRYPSKVVGIAASMPGLGGSGKTLKTLKKYLTTAGHMPKEAHKRLMQKEGAVNMHLRQLRYLAGDLKKGIGKALNGASLTEAGRQKIDQALKGERPITDLPEAVQEPVANMRAHVDALSAELVRTGAVRGEMAATVSANEGIYLHRSYRVFDDPEWNQKVPFDVRNKAEAYLRQEMPDASEEEIQGTLKGLVSPEKAKGDSWQHIAKMRKDLSVLQRRKDIPKILRDFMGEYQDPTVNYVKTIQKLAHLVETHKFLSDVREAGLGVYFFENKIANENGDFVEQIAAENGDFVEQIAAESNSAMAPLNGLYTTAEIKAAFEGAPNTEGPAWLKIYSIANGLTKYGKTVLNPMTHPRNLVGNAVFAVANGHYQADKWGTVTSELATQVRRRSYLLRATELGLMEEGVRAGELGDMVKDASAVDLDEFLFNPEKRRVRAAKNLVKRVSAVPKAMYQWEDTIWKLYAWENEKARYRAAYPEWTKAQVEEKAAEIVRNTYPTYSMIPEGIKQIRRLPVVAPFVSFVSETYRTQYQTLKLATEEMADPRTRWFGAQRVVGVGLGLLGTGAATWYLMTKVGISPQDDDDLRKFVAPWQENSQFAHLGGKDGKYRLVDVRYSDPYATLKAPYKAFVRGEDWETKMKEAAAELAEPFIKDEILFKALVEGWYNQDEDGRPISTDQDTGLESLQARGAHVWEAARPGVFREIDEAKKGLAGEVAEGGKEYKLSTQAKRLLTGFRVQDIDVAQSYAYRARDFKKAVSSVEGELRFQMNQTGHVPPDDLEAEYRRMETRREALFRDMTETTKAAVRLGVRPKALVAAMKDRRLTEDERKQIWYGVYKPFVFTKDRMKAMHDANPTEYPIRRQVLAKARTELIKERQENE